MRARSKDLSSWTLRRGGDRLRPMFFRLLLLFTVLPVVELALLIRIGRAIDVGPTIALVVLTGVAGAALARHQGLRTLRRIQDDLARGLMPATELLNGLMILLAGAVLVTPGVITDAVGFALLIPPVRALIRKRVAAHFKKRIVMMPGPTGFAPPAQNEFIDVEARVVADDDGRPDQDA